MQSQDRDLSLKHIIWTTATQMRILSCCWEPEGAEFPVLLAGPALYEMHWAQDWDFLAHQKTQWFCQDHSLGRKNIYIYMCAYFHRSLSGFPFVAPHLLIILQGLAVTKHGLVVKHLVTRCTTSASSRLVPWVKAPPRLHILLTSSAGEVIHLKHKNRLPSPHNWLFSSARSVPQNGSLTGCRNSCAGPEERVTQAQRWYPSSSISPSFSNQ